MLGALLSRDKHGGEAGEYMIRSLYFDDMYQSAYEEKQSGVYARKKYRIRIYNCLDNVIHLECKYKPVSYTHLDVYKRQSGGKRQDRIYR